VRRAAPSRTKTPLAESVMEQGLVGQAPGIGTAESGLMLNAQGGQRDNYEVGAKLDSRSIMGLTSRRKQHQDRAEDLAGS